MASFWILLCCLGWPQMLLLLQSTEGWFHKLMPWSLGILFILLFFIFLRQVLMNPTLVLNLPCCQGGLFVNLIFFFFGYRVSLCSSHCSGICYVDQTGFVFREILLPLGLKSCATMPCDPLISISQYWDIYHPWFIRRGSRSPAKAS